MSIVEKAPDQRALKIASVMNGENFRKALAATLPRHLPQDRMVRVVLSALQNTPALLECAPDTIVLSVLRAAAMGLEPDGGVLGHGYLVPYWSGKNKRKECQFIPGYRGLIKLARNSGDILDIEANVVRTADKFSYSVGLNPSLEHVPNDAVQDQGDVTHAYAIAVFRSGHKKLTVLNRRELDEIRDTSASRDKTGKLVGPWVDWYGEMAKKTAVRRLCKMLPLSIEIQQQIESEGAASHIVLPDMLTHEEPQTETEAAPGQLFDTSPNATEA